MTSDEEGTEEHVLSLGTEPRRCEIHRRNVSRDAAADKASARRLAGGVCVAEGTQGLSREMRHGAGRSTHDESTFHMAERIPEGTKRKRGVSVEKVDSRRETNHKLNTAPVGPIAM